MVEVDYLTLVFFLLVLPSLFLIFTIWFFLTVNRLKKESLIFRKKAWEVIIDSCKIISQLEDGVNYKKPLKNTNDNNRVPRTYH